MINIIHNILQDHQIEDILTEFKKRKVFTIDFREKYNITYFTKDILCIPEPIFKQISNDLLILNNSILKKITYYILQDHIQDLKRFGFTRRMIDLIGFIFKNLNITSYQQLPLTYLGRYDLLLDNNNKLKIVEINSETPAGMPEAVNTEIVGSYIDKRKYVDTNIGFDYNLYRSTQPILDKVILHQNIKKNFLIIFGKHNNEKLDESREDYSIGLYLTEFFQRQLEEHGINVKLGAAQDLEFRKDGIYYNQIKQDYLWSYYPLEWFFIEKGSLDFVNYYKAGEIEVLNNPLNLITQSKAIWAYLWENIDNNLLMLSNEEKQIIIDYIPRYYFDKPTDKEVLSKPLFYREGVGIGDDNYIGLKVYQELVEQQLVSINCVDGQKEGYLTIGFYYGENGYIGTFNRFCENFITSRCSYVIPLFIEKN